MRNNYADLDRFTAVPFRRPPVAVGEYTVKDAFDVSHRFHLRRMPRAAKYTGRYGLFYHHPDAHWILVGYVDDQKTFQRPVELPREYEPFLHMFLHEPRVLTLRRCAWCGRQMEADNPDDVHRSETCRKNLQEG